MKFQGASVKSFDTIFAKHSSKIEAFPGCLRVQMVEDVSDDGVRTTLSWWSDSASLERYRGSELFGELWPRVKLLFEEPPVAWSSNCAPSDVPKK